MPFCCVIGNAGIPSSLTCHSSCSCSSCLLSSFFPLPPFCLLRVKTLKRQEQQKNLSTCMSLDAARIATAAAVETHQLDRKTENCSSLVSGVTKDRFRTFSQKQRTKLLLICNFALKVLFRSFAACLGSILRRCCTFSALSLPVFLPQNC